MSTPKPLSMIALKALFDDATASVDQRFGTLHQMFLAQAAELETLRNALAAAPRSSNRPERIAETPAPTVTKEPVPLEKALELLSVAFEEALMGCGGAHDGRQSTLFGGSTGKKPDGWKSTKWAGDTMPNSERNQWCVQARSKVVAAGFEADKKVTGPALLALISDAWTSIAPAQDEAQADEPAEEPATGA